ncbi:MAG: energy transducer TonB [Bryobacteraceae bacterium]
MRPRSFAGSVAVHAAGLLALLLAGRFAPVAPPVRPPVTVDISLPPPPKLVVPRTATEKDAGGSGGGDQSPLPVALGRVPRSAKPFMPPQQVIRNENPIIEIPPSLEIADVVPDVKVPQWGNPLAPPGPPSNGTGRNGSMGNKTGPGGPGDGRGPGVGPGIGPGVYRAGTGGVTIPRLVFSVEPEYSEEARKSKFQGTVVLSIVVDPSGVARDIRVIGAAGLGLDEKAVEAVRRWRFRPGTRNGQPVPVLSRIEVNFRLL